MTDESEEPGPMFKAAAERLARPSPRRILVGLLSVAVVVSVVHYVDNFANYADYPQSDSELEPSRALVGISWFVFTGFGAAGFVLFLRQRIAAAVACLAVYSLSGLVGFGHYAVPAASEMPLWRQLHIVADIACGVAVLAFAVWALRRQGTRPTPAEA